jgi:NAD+ synthase
MEKNPIKLDGEGNWGYTGMMKIKEKISTWIKREVLRAGRKGAVFGLSGGLDSAVVGVLCKTALDDNALALIMPCESQKDDIDHAQLVVKQFQIQNELIDLTRLYKNFLSILPEADSLTEANLKPRLRMVALYFYAHKLNYLVVGTGNKSELSIGYFTKFGDGGCDLLPLGDLYKTEVKKLAAELGVPGEIVKKPPSAGLWEGQTDEGEIGVTYENLDKILSGLERGKVIKGVPKKDIFKIKSLINSAVHKSLPPKIFKR